MRLGSWVPFACVTWLVACGGDGGSDEIPFTEACTGGVLEYAKGFRPEPAVDFIGFRTERTTPREATGPNAQPGDQEAAWSASFSGDVFGTLCGGATDRPACEQRVASEKRLGEQCQGLPIVPLFSGEGAERAPAPNGTCQLTYVLYTRGDEIGVVQTYEEARALFGRVDSPEEALYLVRLQGGVIACAGSTPAATRKTDAGYEVRAGRACGGSTLYQVSNDGAVRVLETEGDSPAGCR